MDCVISGVDSLTGGQQCPVQHCTAESQQVTQITDDTEARRPVQHCTAESQQVTQITNDTRHLDAVSQQCLDRHSSAAAAAADDDDDDDEDEQQADYRDPMTSAEAQPSHIDEFGIPVSYNTSDIVVQ